MALCGDNAPGKGTGGALTVCTIASIESEVFANARDAVVYTRRLLDANKQTRARHVAALRKTKTYFAAPSPCKKKKKLPRLGKRAIFQHRVGVAFRPHDRDTDSNFSCSNRPCALRRTTRRNRYAGADFVLFTVVVVHPDGAIDDGPIAISMFTNRRAARRIGLVTV